MSDFADDIVTEAMQHNLVRNQNGRARRVEGWLRCYCGQSVWAKDVPATPWEEERLEQKHRLYIAITATIKHLMAGGAVRLGPLGVPMPEAQNDIKLFGEERLAIEDEMVPFTKADYDRVKKYLPEPKPKPGDPCPTCGTPMRRMADGSGECLSDHK